MHGLTRLLKSFVANESGATAIEYGLIVALIFLVILTSVTAVADETTAMFDIVSAAMAGI